MKITLSCRRENILLIETFLLIFLTSSFTVINDILPTSMTIVLWVASIVMMIPFIKTIDSKNLLALIILTISMWFSVIINHEKELVAAFVTFAFLCAYVYSTIFSFNEFRSAFCKLMRFLCVISLIGFITVQIIPVILNTFVVKNLNGIYFSNFLLYVHTRNFNRNCGMFWEPGAFQSFISLALLFEITDEKATPRVRDMIIYAISLITTFSTTAFIALGGILLIGVNRKGAQSKKIKWAIFFGSIAMLIWGFMNQDLLFSTATNSVFGKLTKFISKQEYLSNGGVSSTAIRYYSITKPFESFLRSPIFGRGYNGLIEETYQYTRGLITCTFVNWFAVYGVLFGAVMSYGYFKLSRLISRNLLLSVIVFVVFFVITGSENYVNNGFFVMLALYGTLSETFFQKGAQQ